MNKNIRYIANITGTAVLIILLLSIILFWADKISDIDILTNGNFYNHNYLSPSGLIKDEQKISKEYAEKNQVFSFSQIRAGFDYDPGLIWLQGIIKDIKAEEKNSDLCNYFDTDNSIYNFLTNIPRPSGYIKNSRLNRIYFDKDKGLFVFCKLVKVKKGPNKWSKNILFYIGPEGINEKPQKQLGRFIQPIIPKRYTDGISDILYDKALHRFFKIKITDAEQSVVKGPELDNKKYDPIQMGFGKLDKFKPNMLNSSFSSPMYQHKENNKWKANHIDEFEPNRQVTNYITVINKNGRIDLFNKETMEIRDIGNLPEYAKLQYSYSVEPIFFKDNYTGVIISTTSSNFRQIETRVINAEGKIVNHGSSFLKEREIPGGMASIYEKYIIENLQPVAFNIFSCLVAKNYDGSKSQQAMFLRPNSIAAWFIRTNDSALPIKILVVLLIMGPSIIIGIILGWRVSKRAKTLGLSKLATGLWTYGTIFTGIAGYLTFRLTKHNEAMVTCKNCGQLRQVEQQRCHHCKSDWQMKHLKSANWRILEI